MNPWREKFCRDQLAPPRMGRYITLDATPYSIDSNNCTITGTGGTATYSTVTGHAVTNTCACTFTNTGNGIYTTTIDIGDTNESS